MDISAIIKAVLSPLEERTSPSLVELKPGDQLTGRVLKVQSDGRVLIDLGGRRALAQIGFSVKSGQNLKLQVINTGSVLHLRADAPLEGIKTPLSFPRTDFSQSLNARDQAQFVQLADKLMTGTRPSGATGASPKAIQNALAQIKTVFENIPMDRSTEQISTWIKTAVEDRGVLFEKQMADVTTNVTQSSTKSNDAALKLSPDRILITHNVKSQLLQLKKYLSQPGEQNPVFEKLHSKEVSFLRRSLDRMLGHIEQQQDRAVARWGEGENQQVIVHTLPLQDQKRPIQLKLFYPRKDNQKEQARQQRIALLLNLDHLGDVRVDLFMMDKHLQIGFFVENVDIQKLLSQHVQEVDTALNSQFDKIEINISVSKEKISQFEKEDIIGAELGRVNINV